jgi:signal transduction histidine kinase
MVDLKIFRSEDNQQTYFADPRRVSAEVLDYQIHLVCSHPVIDELLKIFGGVVLVLNECRQAVAVNDIFLSTLGIEDPKEVLGLRPGEAVLCAHAESAPNGCGTAEACASCGAALAIVASLELTKPMEKECLILRKVSGKEESLEFAVRAAPITIEGRMFALVTMLDISEKKKAEVVERMFIHDLLNCIQGLRGMSDLLIEDNCEDAAVGLRRIRDLTDYLAEMTDAHRELIMLQTGAFHCEMKDVALTDVLERVSKILDCSGAARHKTILVENDTPDLFLKTDKVLLSRVVINMVKNALEAGPSGASIVLRCKTPDDNSFTLSVWNAEEMPRQTSLRVFQRYFSTKGGRGRGVGTYSMKLIAERCLNGSMTFSTGKEGTVFSLSLPM